MTLILFKVIFPVKNVITIKEKGILNLDWQIILQLIWLRNELIKKKLGIPKNLAIPKSQKNCDHSKYHNFIPSSWDNIFMMKFKRDCYWVVIILLRKSKMKH